MVSPVCIFQSELANDANESRIFFFFLRSSVEGQVVEGQVKHFLYSFYKYTPSF